MAEEIHEERNGRALVKVLFERSLPRGRSWWTLTVVWVLTLSALIFISLTDFSGNAKLDQALVRTLSITFVVALIWRLSRYQSRGRPLSEEDTASVGRLRFRWMLLTLTFVLIIVPTLVSLLLVYAGFEFVGLDFAIESMRYLSPWIVLEFGLSLTALGFIAAWRRNLSWRLCLLSLAVGLLTALAQLVPTLATKDEFHLFWLLFQLTCIPLLFAGGGLLLHSTGLGRVRLLEGRYLKAGRSFFFGVLLFLPLGLANSTGAVVSGFTWMHESWQPFLFSWQPALAEETWARLFLVPLCYWLLRPLTPNHPNRAVVAALFLSACAHGLAHVHTLELFGPLAVETLRAVINAILVTSLVYLLPIALLFVRRDWEQAVGAHYAVNLVPLVLLALAG